MSHNRPTNPRQVRNKRASDLIPRNEREQLARERSLSVIALMRQERISLRAASKVEGTTPETVQKYAASALKRSGARGIFQVKKFDRLARDVNFLTHDGYREITIRDSRIASAIALHMNAVRKYRNTGNTSDLAKFAGKAFRADGENFVFITDPVLVDRLANAGLPYTEGLYRAVQGGM